MRRKSLKHLAIGVLVPLMTLSAIAAGGHVTASAASAAITLKPSSGPPTSTTVVSGSGFGAGELVDVYFDTTDTLLASASSTGTFKVKLHVPASAQPGDHYVTAAGRTSALSAQRTFTVRTNWPEYGSTLQVTARTRMRTHSAWGAFPTSRSRSPSPRAAR